MKTYLLASLRRLLISARWSFLPCIVLGTAATIAAAPAFGQTSGTITAQLVSMTPHLTAYAQVKPISTLPLNASETGIVSGLSVLPGMHVQAGEKLAHLNGPGIRSMLLQGKANVRSASAQLSAAEKSLAIQREQLRAHLSTREQVHRVASAAAQAQAMLDNAQSRLVAVQEMAAIVAPTDAIVTALNSSNGELVSAGQPVITVQPARALWLRASYYGNDLNAIRTGMAGTFQPSDGSARIPVRVRAISGVMGAGGGESIVMNPLHPGTQWLNGEFGTVTLNSAPRKLVAVPTRALILSQGKWWVLIHTAHGDHPQEVVPGPALGWNTFIARGLPPGSQVIVNNAYLLFHTTITEQYQIPD